MPKACLPFHRHRQRQSTRAQIAGWMASSNQLRHGDEPQAMPESVWVPSHHPGRRGARGGQCQARHDGTLIAEEADREGV